MNAAIFAFGVFSAVRFLQADEARALAVWGAAMLLSFVTVSAIKVWYWLEMNRLALTREIKRLDLRVIELGRRLEKAKG